MNGGCLLGLILAIRVVPSTSHVYTFDEGGKARVTSSRRIAIVKFDPVGCPNCEVVDKFWDLAAKNFRNSHFTLWRVSCTLHRSVCDGSNIGVSSDPIFDAWTGSGFTRYSGPKDVEKLLLWIHEIVGLTQMQQPVQPVLPSSGEYVGPPVFRMTQLHAAALEGNTMKMASDIRAGADVDARNVNGATPLVMAAQAGHLLAATLLLDSKCNINAADELGLTALLAATIGGHAEVVAMLLARGASVSIATQESFSLVDVARGEGHHEVVNVISSSQSYVPFRSCRLRRLSAFLWAFHAPSGGLGCVGCAWQVASPKRWHDAEGRDAAHLQHGPQVHLYQSSVVAHTSNRPMAGLTRHGAMLRAVAVGWR
jgi:hypothetical protein